MTDRGLSGPGAVSLGAAGGGRGGVSDVSTGGGRGLDVSTGGERGLDVSTGGGRDASPGFEGVSPQPGAAIPATGAWREGDPVGDRLFASLGAIPLEVGGELDVRLAYETWGRLNEARDNAVLVLHALTGDSHIRGEAGPGHPTAGWWSSLIGPGAPVDTSRYFVVAPNVLGGCQGSTGPSSPCSDGRPWGSRFPYLTIRDQVRAEIALADALGVRRWALIIGGSAGGMRVLEWATMVPERVAAIVPVSTAARSTADQIAWAHAQLLAIRADAHFLGGDYYDQPAGSGPHVGLGIARQIAHTTYRSSLELEIRFGAEVQGSENPLGGGGRFAVQSYLEHHGAKLALRFDANSYVVLTEAILSHDLGRDRGGVSAALSRISARALVVAVDSDRLYLPEQSDALAAEIPHAGPVHTVHSDYGHDGFLIEFNQLAPRIRDFLEGR